MDSKRYINEIRYIEAKSILSKLKENDTFFGISYNMNLYRGCQHGCIYCDTRSECYGIHDISKISVKKNALELLEKELSVRRRVKGTIGTGSMNDPYMPLEAKLQLTRRALQIISDKKYPVHIITKSNLVERDVDIIRNISQTYAVISFTITTDDDILSGKIEPFASLSSQRFKAMEVIATNGIYTGITLMPLLPYINDTKENIENILWRAKDAGASYVLPMFGVTLRKGSRDYFYRQLEKNFPGLKEKYHSRFGEQYICSAPQYQMLNDTFNELAAKLDIATSIKFYDPPTEERQLSFF